MKKQILLLMTICLSMTSLKAQSTSLSGSGTSIDPYLIGTIDDLKYFRDKINLTDNNVYDQVGAYFKLTSDLDLSAESPWSPIGNNPNSTNNFKGNFDGNNKIISNLTIGTLAVPVYQNPNSGLFGTASNSATIKNLTLSNISFYLNRTLAGSFMAGGLAGQITAGVKIENCHVSGVINATNADNTNAADMEIGGLVGKIQRGPDVAPASDLIQIINSSTDVDIVATSTSTYTTADKKVYAAGIVGNMAAASFVNLPILVNCYSKGDVMGESTVDFATTRSRQAVQVGGLWGNNSGKIYNSYASGHLKGKTVTANVNVCGITSFLNTGTLTKCYAVMDSIRLITSSGTQVGRRISNGVGSSQVISAYSFANTKINGAIIDPLTNAQYGEQNSNGLNISAADFITGLNAYVSANPTSNGVNLKTWSAISASSNDVSKGSVSGSTTALDGQNVTLAATGTSGNHFVRWTEGGNEVSGAGASYTFVASGNRILVAEFSINTGMENATEDAVIIVDGKILRFRIAANAQVYNTLGRLVAKSTSATSSLQLSQAGIYIVRINTPQGTKTQKIIIN